MRAVLPMPFVMLAFLAWGVLGPALYVGQDAMGQSALRSLICVGLAYFVVAVIAPIAFLRTQGEGGHWTLAGAIWSLAAGTAGALGALGIILAFKFGGRPNYVMPLMFGWAPVVNKLVTMATARTLREASMRFVSGILLIVVGSVGVLVFKPGAKDVAIADLTIRQFVVILSMIGFTACCWGVYGPILHKGQMKMAGSRLRPYLCVGLAYLIIAVILPLVMLWTWNERGAWSFTGVVWTHAAGAAAALGALGIVLAFHIGGKPVYVMPLVFGCAPIVNTVTTVGTEGTQSPIPWFFYGSLSMVILGAVSVLVFAPQKKSSPPVQPPPSPQSQI